MNNGTSASTSATKSRKSKTGKFVLSADLFEEMKRLNEQSEKHLESAISLMAESNEFLRKCLEVQRSPS